MLLSVVFGSGSIVALPLRNQRLRLFLSSVDSVSRSLALFVVLKPEELTNVANQENHNKTQIEYFQ
jgi:hypothetical protein